MNQQEPKPGLSRLKEKVAFITGVARTEERPWRPEDGCHDQGIFNPRLSAPIPRPGRSEEAAELALFLATNESSYITGAKIVIDGGGTIVEPFIYEAFGHSILGEMKK